MNRLLPYPQDLISRNKHLFRHRPASADRVPLLYLELLCPDIIHLIVCYMRARHGLHNIYKKRFTHSYYISQRRFYEAVDLLLYMRLYMRILRNSFMRRRTIAVGERYFSAHLSDLIFSADCFVLLALKKIGFKLNAAVQQS